MVWAIVVVVAVVVQVAVDWQARWTWRAAQDHKKGKIPNIGEKGLNYVTIIHHSLAESSSRPSFEADVLPCGCNKTVGKRWKRMGKKQQIISLGWLFQTALKWTSLRTGHQNMKSENTLSRTDLFLPQRGSHATCPPPPFATTCDRDFPSWPLHRREWSTDLEGAAAMFASEGTRAYHGKQQHSSSNKDTAWAIEDIVSFLLYPLRMHIRAASLSMKTTTCIDAIPSFQRLKPTRTASVSSSPITWSWP